MTDKRQPVQAFTIKSICLAKEILTDAWVSDAYDPNEILLDSPNEIKVAAVWDTGATRTVISMDLAKQLKLVPTGIASYDHAGGSSGCNTYIINVTLPNNVRVEGLKVFEALTPGCDVLIGMDIITLGDFALTHRCGESCFSFRTPSLVEIDFLATEDTFN